MTEMTDEQFQEEIHTLIKQKKAADVTLEEEASRNWGEIVAREYLFDRHEKDIVILENLDGKKAVLGMAKLFLGEQNPGGWKKLGVQIVGNKIGASSTEEQPQSVDENITDGADPDGKFDYEYLKVDPEDKREFVTNVKEFADSMDTYPAIKIIT